MENDNFLPSVSELINAGIDAATLLNLVENRRKRGINVPSSGDICQMLKEYRDKQACQQKAELTPKQMRQVAVRDCDATLGYVSPEQTAKELGLPVELVEAVSKRYNGKVNNNGQPF